MRSKGKEKQQGSCEYIQCYIYIYILSMKQLGSLKVNAGYLLECPRGNYGPSE